MNIETTKNLFIRTMKLIGSGALVFLMIFLLALMFCEYQKVAALLFSPDVIGLVGLTTGLTIGFALGVYVTYKVYESENDCEKFVQDIFEKAKHKNEPKPRKKQHPKAPTAPARPANSKAPQTEAAPTKTPKSQAPVQQQTPTADAPVTDNYEDARAKKIFGILDEFSDSYEIPADEVFGDEDAPEDEVLEAPDAEEVVADNNTLQVPLSEESSSEDELTKDS